MHQLQLVYRLCLFKFSLVGVRLKPRLGRIEGWSLLPQDAVHILLSMVRRGQVPRCRLVLGVVALWPHFALVVPPQVSFLLKERVAK